MSPPVTKPVEVLSPLAFGPTDAQPMHPGLRSLVGCHLGVRHDKAWRSFDFFADEVVTRLKEQHRIDRATWFDPGTRIGRPEQESARVAEFARGLDAAVVGLGT